MNMKNHTLSIAVAQLCSTENIEKNFEKIERAVRATASRHVDLVCFPEIALYLRAEGERIDWNLRIERDLFGRMQSLARGNRLHIHLGSMPVAVKGKKKIYNTSFLFAPDGSIKAQYEKIHLFDVTLPGGRTLLESKNVAAGSSIVNTKIHGWNLGLSICYDVRFPELYRKLRLRGANVLMVPAAQTGKHSPMRESYGHSLIIDPWGTIIAEAGTKETILYATLDKNQIEQVRQRMPCWSHRKLPV